MNYEFHILIIFSYWTEAWYSTARNEAEIKYIGWYLWHLSNKYLWDYPFAVHMQLDDIFRTEALISHWTQWKLSLIKTQTVPEIVLQYLVQLFAWNKTEP